MNIEFLDDLVEDFPSEYISIPVSINGNRLICKFSYNAIYDITHKTGAEPLEIFEGSIEELKKYALSVILNDDAKNDIILIDKQDAS